MSFSPLAIFILSNLFCLLLTDWPDNSIKSILIFMQIKYTNLMGSERAGFRINLRWKTVELYLKQRWNKVKFYGIGLKGTVLHGFDPYKVETRINQSHHIHFLHKMGTTFILENNYEDYQSIGRQVIQGLILGIR